MSSTERARAALQLAFVGDSLAAPAHWYYRPAEILRDFPPLGIQELRPCPARHPGAIMSLHSTKRGGRSGRGKTNAKPAAEIIGEVILKGRRDYWKQSGTHYHRELPAGENTLNAWCARWLTEDLTEHGGYDSERWLARYIDRMTADPPAHPDTYAESYHRGFFANWIAGAPARDCGAVTHDTASIGALVTVTPLALTLLRPATENATRSLADTQSICRQHAAFTHPDPLVDRVIDAYVILLDRLIHRAPDTPADPAWFCQAAMAVPGVRIEGLLEAQSSQAVASRFSIACYLDGSWPIVCALAARHLDSPREALLVNTNLGGDNVHRGWVLGSLLGAAQAPGSSLPWFEELHRYEELKSMIDAWETRFSM